MTRQLSKLACHALSAGLALAHSLAFAVLSVQELLPMVTPRAAQSVAQLGKFRKSPAQIDTHYLSVMDKAERHWDEGQVQEALEQLQQLDVYAPLSELPFVKAHLLLAAMAEKEGNVDMRNHHRAFAKALIDLIAASGDGQSPASAFRVRLPSDMTAWWFANSHWGKPVGTRQIALAGKRFVAWQLQATDDSLREVYFHDPVGAAANARKGLVQKSQSPQTPKP
jgi:hypothetical protein